MTNGSKHMRFHVARASLLSIVLALALSCGCVINVPCALAETSASASQVRYTNPFTDYVVVIIDDAGLLSEQEEESLVEDMVPITAYGNVAFWSTREPAPNEVEQARVKRLSLFEYSDATIFMINMRQRRLAIQSYGTLYKGINDSRARSITDNVSSYATKGNYYKAAKECYAQINAVMEGSNIPEPMKQTGYAVLAVILGFTIALGIAFSARFNPLRAVAEDAYALKGEGTLYEEGKKVIISEEEYTVGSGGGGGGGGCGGGGCGGGGCGGGGCGGGGGSGF